MPWNKDTARLLAAAALQAGQPLSSALEEGQHHGHVTHPQCTAAANYLRGRLDSSSGCDVEASLPKAHEGLVAALLGLVNELVDFLQGEGRGKVGTSVKPP